MAPVSNVIWGVPVTVTFSEKVTVTLIVSPIPYAPSAVSDDTFVISRYRGIYCDVFVDWPSEPAAPGDGKRKVCGV